MAHTHTHGRMYSEIAAARRSLSLGFVHEAAAALDALHSRYISTRPFRLAEWLRRRRRSEEKATGETSAPFAPAMPQSGRLVACELSIHDAALESSRLLEAQTLTNGCGK